MIYVNEFTKLIEFDILNPENLIGIVYPDFKIDELITGIKAKVIVSSDQEASLFDDIKIFMIALVCGIVALVVMLVLLFVKKCKHKIQKKLWYMKKGFFFNGFVASIEVSYIQTLLSVGVQIRLFLRNSIY